MGEAFACARMMILVLVPRFQLQSVTAFHTPADRALANPARVWVYRLGSDEPW